MPVTTKIKPAAAPTKSTLQGLAGAVIAIRAANKAIELQPKMPVLDIKELKDVNKSLATAQSHADYCTKTLIPEIEKELQSIIDYNTIYSALATSINAAISEIKGSTKSNPPHANTMTNLAAELGALQGQVRTVLYGDGGTKEKPNGSSALGTYNALVAYQSNVADDSKAFKGYRDFAYNSRGGVANQIKQYGVDIDNDREAMAKDRAMIAGGAAMIIVGILILVVAVALAPETGGATIAAIGTLGVATVAGGATMIGVSAHDLDTKETDVTNKLIAIAKDKTELAALSAIGNHSGDVATHTDTIYGAVDTLKTSWEQMDNAMSSVISALTLPQSELMDWIKNESGSSNPTYKIMGTILEAQFAAPQSDWADASKNASTILQAFKNVIFFELPKNTVATQKVMAANSVKHHNS